MSVVKIFLDKGEKLEDVEADLFKALGHHASGDIHETESFQDPAMNDVADKMKKTHAVIYQEMLDEIFKALESDYRK